MCPTSGDCPRIRIDPRADAARPGHHVDVMDALLQSPTLKSTHMALAALSVGGFAARGLGVLLSQGRSRWPLWPAVRVASMVLDSLLLAAGVGLWVGLGLSLPQQPWLAAKLGLLLAYIVLGSLALKRASTLRGRALAYAGALTCALSIAWIALQHDPLAPLRGWLLR